MKKPTKQQAYDIALLGSQEGVITDVESIRALVRYFAPPVPKTAKNAEEWVSMACAKNDIREWVNLVYAHDGWLYGTDGNRMHRARTLRADGYYEPFTFLPTTFTHQEHPVARGASSFFSGRMGHVAVSLAVTINGRDVKNNVQLDFGPGSALFDRRLIMQACNGDTGVGLYLHDRKAEGVSAFGEFVVMGVRRD